MVSSGFEGESWFAGDVTATPNFTHRYSGELLATVYIPESDLVNAIIGIHAASASEGLRIQPADSSVRINISGGIPIFSSGWLHIPPGEYVQLQQSFPGFWFVAFATSPLYDQDGVARIASGLPIPLPDTWGADEGKVLGVQSGEFNLVNPNGGFWDIDFNEARAEVWDDDLGWVGGGLYPQVSVYTNTTISLSIGVGVDSSLAIPENGRMTVRVLTQDYGFWTRYYGAFNRVSVGTTSGELVLPIVATISDLDGTLALIFTLQFPPEEDNLSWVQIFVS